MNDKVHGLIVPFGPKRIARAQLEIEHKTVQQARVALDGIGAFVPYSSVYERAVIAEVLLVLLERAQMLEERLSCQTE
jgi:hypothetical protein